MVYVVDNREQPTQALEKRLEFLQPYTRETLNAGDYTAKTFPGWKHNPYRKRLTRAKRLALALVEHRRYRILKQLFAMKG